MIICDWCGLNGFPSDDLHGLQACTSCTGEHVVDRELGRCYLCKQESSPDPDIKITTYSIGE